VGQLYLLEAPILPADFWQEKESFCKAFLKPKSH